MRITKTDIVRAQKQWLISHGPNGDIIYGDQILEYAYHRLRREQVDGIHNGDASGRTVMRRGNDNVIASDGGWPEDALRHMLGDWFNTGQVKIDSIDSLIKKDGTMISLISKLENNDTHTYSGKDTNNKNIDIHYAHAYSVKGITNVNGKIVFEIVNPHDSARSFRMTLEQVKQYFERASYAQPRNNNARQAAFATSAALTH